MVEQPKVWFSMKDEASLWKANENHPEHDTEERRVGEENVEDIVEDQSTFATQFWVDPVGGKKEQAEVVQGSKDTSRKRKQVLKRKNSPLRRRQRAILALNTVLSS